MINLTFFEVAIILFVLLLNVVAYVNLNSISKFINLYDYPDGYRKIHTVKTPLIGGVIIFFSIILYITLLVLNNNFSYENFYFFSFKSVLTFYFTLSLIFLLGFYDDKKPVSPNTKLIILFTACYIYSLSDSTILIKNINLESLNLSINIHTFSSIFTCLVIITFIIAANMFDGINGQSSIFFIFNLLILIIFDNYISNFLIFIILIILIFLFFNLKSKVFLGDNGIFVLGFIISVFYLKSYNIYHNFSFDTLILIALIPLIDLIRVSTTRIFNRRNPMSPDKIHFHHILMHNKYKLFIVQIVTIMPILLNFLIKNYFISSVIPIIIYFYLIKKK